MSFRYDLSISGEASRFLFGSLKKLRSKAEDIFDYLAKHPFTEGDFPEKTPAGRIHQVKVFENIIVTYWADHGARELRIIRFEVVD